MKKYEIVFTSSFDLLDFVTIIQTNIYKHSLANNTVVCAWCDSEIELAVNAYSAKIKLLS